MSKVKHSRIENDDVRAVVGRNVRRYRTGKNLTQMELATRLTVDRSYVIDLENGNRNPTLTSLDDVAFVLGVFIVDLLQLDTIEVENKNFIETT
jgi:transcriptional regulator with XRE-family HTH domain